jgi:chemotaxis protein histidine kinase CheA/ActR/RegA family two-component response regulator
MTSRSNEFRVTLDPEIAATIDIVTQLLGAQELGTQEIEEDGRAFDAEPLARLAEHLGRVGTVASAQGLFGLHDVCALFQAGLLAIVDQGRPLGAKELEVLLEWPDRVIDYLDAPVDAGKARALVDLLARPAWTLSIAGDEVSVLAELLTAMPEDGDVWDDEGRSARAEKGPDEENSRDRAVEIEPLVDEFLTLDPVAAEQDAHNAAMRTDDGLEIAVAAPLTAPEDVSEQSVVGELYAVCREAESADEVDADTESSTSTVNRELVALLEAEVKEMEPSLVEALAETRSEARESLLESLAEVMARMTEAAEAVEMPGLSQVCAHTASNLAILAEDGAAGDVSMLGAWPTMVLAYLATPGDPERCRELVGYLQLPGWPYELDGELAEELIQSLRIELADVAPEPAEQRQTRATDEDTSLAVPEDVNQELLESLLQELPGLTAQFSATIHRLAKGEGTLEDLTTAQRAAHTLKGAANTVGVVGIATLAHHVEDILQAMAKQSELPAESLCDCLIDASDCLEMMAEALLGIGEAPTETRTVLQQVLDWANWIDNNGLATAEDSLPAASAQAEREDTVAEGDIAGAAAEAVQSTQGASQKAQVASIATARASASQADELLRLSGELNILQGQLTNRLDRAAEDVSAWQEHGNLLQQLAIELEQIVDIRGISWANRKGATGDQFDPLEMDQYNELHTLSRRLTEAASDARELGQQVNTHLESMKALFVAQSRLQRDNEETVLRTRMVPAQTVVARLQRSVRQTCRVADKQVELQVTGADTLIDSEVLNGLTDPLMHLLRNAVDHGIESRQDRLARNKPETGSITLEFGRSGNHIMIRCRDDGAGLDLDAIRRKAEQHELIKSGQPSSREELSRLILRPGFSTRDVTTQVSGRGIGMDAVYHSVQRLKGSLQLHSEPGAGLVVELLLPASLLSSHGVLVRAGEQRIAISSRGVEQILPPAAGELGRLGEYQTYKVGETVYEAVQFEALLNREKPAEAAAPRPALLVRDSAAVVRAVLVEEVLESRTLVVKSISEYVPKLRGIAGATILGDGSVAPVIDLEALVHEPVVEPAQKVSSITGTSEPMARQRLRALVVDDSLSARRSMTQFLEDAGFEVESALDGLDAVAELEKALPDILLVDLEMPRMNGLELTRHVRGNATTQQLPVIMVTSRSTGKHRHEAEAAGVSAYVNKPFAEDDLLRIISELTALRGAA